MWGPVVEIRAQSDLVHSHKCATNCIDQGVGTSIRRTDPFVTEIKMKPRDQDVNQPIK